MLLKDIREAVKSYLDNRVVVSISNIVPDVPITLSPNEGFTFSVSARNAGSGDPEYAKLNLPKLQLDLSLFNYFSEK